MAKSLEESSEKHLKELKLALSKQRQEHERTQARAVSAAREEGMRIGREEGRREASAATTGAAGEVSVHQATKSSSYSLAEIAQLKQRSFDDGYNKAKQELSHRMGTTHITQDVNNDVAVTADWDTATSDTSMG